MQLSLSVPLALCAAGATLAASIQSRAASYSGAFVIRGSVANYAAYGAFNGDKDQYGAERLVTLQSNGRSVTGQKFNFVTLNVASLGTQDGQPNCQPGADNSICIGMLQTAEDPQSCIVAPKLEPSDADDAGFRKRACVGVDIPQLSNQAFQLVYNSTAGPNPQLAFYGSGDKHDGQYAVQIADTQLQDVQLIYGTRTTQYSLFLGDE